MAAILTGVPITAGTIFTAKVLAFTTLTTTIIRVGITGAIIIRAIMVEEAMGAVMLAVVVMAAAGMAAAGINSECISASGNRTEVHKGFGIAQVTALPGDHLIRSACCQKVAVDGELFPRYPISATLSEVTVVLEFGAEGQSAGFVLISNLPTECPPAPSVLMGNCKIKPMWRNGRRNGLKIR
jgi:hypothetical protein